MTVLILEGMWYMLGGHAVTIHFMETLHALVIAHSEEVASDRCDV